MDPAPSPFVIPAGESSGTVVTVAREGQATDALMSPTKQPNSPTDGEALESHEVIELQTFIERKVWIEEKIKFLEALPPIEVFIGVEALETSAEEIPGLPSREQLKQWLAEHEVIEKETEIFDTGELKKLRKTTRAATQRNLSPEDTDLIELTLNTIYQLDRLLHLLRDRSEHLDLLGVRLSWEENRILSWVDRRQLIADLNAFLASRARWSPAVYEHAPAPASTPAAASPYSPSARRRGSTASLASLASEAGLASPGFSRTARFAQAELLSRDAAQFAGRVTSLRHGSIATAGKILDKLIDNSRKPVPEILLDEQDRLEDMGAAQLENISKFVMNVVMQWRTADGIYVETVKDQAAANTLLSEIDNAKFQHPTARLSSSFISRADTLRKRLAVRGDPTAPGSTFPCPTHALFPEQDPFNSSLVHSLSREITSALAILQTAEVAAGEYRVSFEAVKAFEIMTQSATQLTSQYDDILRRLESGVPADDGDGSPPNLHSVACLDPTAHSVFLALLPTILYDLDSLNASTALTLKAFPAALMRVNAGGIDAEFREQGVEVINKLKEHQEKAGKLRTELSARVDRLREARRLKTLVDDRSKTAMELIREIDGCMLKSRWRQTTTHSGAPPTPESPSTVPLPSLPMDVGFHHQVEELTSDVARGIFKPLHSLSQSLETELKDALQSSSNDLQDLLERSRRGVDILASIKAQAAMMEAVRDEANNWRVAVEDVKVQYDTLAQECLNDHADTSTFLGSETQLTESSERLRSDITAFLDSLPRRVQFIEREASAPLANRLTKAPVLPFTLRSLDDAVRHDCNDFSMRLNGDLRGLEHKANHLHLTKIAKDVDTAISVSVADIADASQKLASLKYTQHNIGPDEDLQATLTGLLFEVDNLSQSSRQRFSRSLSPSRDLLRIMGTTPGVNDPAVHEVLFLSRKRKLSDAELKLKVWEEQVQMFRTTVVDAQRNEASRLEAVRIAEEERMKAEQERLAAEAAEKARFEEEEQEHLRALQAKKAEEQRLEEERVRLAAQVAERARLEAERLLREEEERNMEAKRAALENAKRLEEQRAKEEQDLREREAREEERIAMEVKLRKAEEELAAERQAQADRLASDLQAKLKAASEAQPGPLAFPTNDQSESAEDVFGPRRNAGDKIEHKSQEIIDLQVRILNLRKRLRALSLSSVSRPASSSTSLPTEDDVEEINRVFVSICSEVTQLPSSIDDQSAQVELDSLQHEITVSVDLMDRIRILVNLTQAVALCDSTLSDLLEHVDSYPALPTGALSSSYRPSEQKPAEEQLTGRLDFTKSAMDNLEVAFLAVSDDPRAVAEHHRVRQTWDELKEMASDRISGRKSRPSSVISSVSSSGRNSRISVSSTSMSKPAAKKAAYASLSVSSRPRGGGLAVPSTSRRAVSNSTERSSSRMSTTSTRSTSGSMGLYGTTFASRQRTTSLTPQATPPRRTSGTVPPRMQTPTMRRGAASPSISEISSVSNMASSRLSTSTTSWSRAPRLSFSTTPRSPPRKVPVPRKAYVANPKSKLDVAVGDVVNNLPVGINIEGVSGSWKDQSGKYWIGDQDPRLCFCRILRSQTVMVRVGGGWQELSKFIRGHFADSFRLLPDSPQIGTREERWISASTLMETPEDAGGSPPRAPHTPEPLGPYLPSFTVSTPGQSPKSMKSTPSPNGSPLTPLQFLRRADPEASFLRPSTPSRPSTSTTRPRMTPTPVRNSVWRP